MLAAKACNYTVVVNEIDSGVTQIECLCSVYFHHYYLMLPQSPLRVVVSRTAHPLEPYWLFSVEIHLKTSHVNK